MCFIQANQNLLLSLMFSCFSSLRLVFHASSFLKLFFSPQCVLICFNFGQLLPNQVATPRRTSGCLNFSHQCFLRVLRDVKQRSKKRAFKKPSFHRIRGPFFRPESAHFFRPVDAQKAFYCSHVTEKIIFSGIRGELFHRIHVEPRHG